MKTAVSSPESLKNTEFKEMKEICARIRENIIDYTSENGGFLASNLSNVEIAVVLNRIFDKDERILYAGNDLNYADLLLHGCEDLSACNADRKDVMAESLGMASAMSLEKNNSSVIAVINSADLLSSKGLEALQMIHESKDKVIIVFNDTRNAKGVKVLEKVISRLRNTKSYNALKENVKDAIRPVKFGDQIIESIHDLKGKVRKTIVDEGVFAQYDIDYIGPVNGHDLKELERAFELAKEKNGSVVVHCITVSGKGYEFAEKDLSHSFDRIGKFNRQTGKPLHCETDDYCFASRILARYVKKQLTADKKFCCLISNDEDRNCVNELFAAYPERCFVTQSDVSTGISFEIGILENGYGVYLPLKASELAEAYPALCRIKENYPKPVIISLIKDSPVDYDLLNVLDRIHVCEPKDAEGIEKTVQTALHSLSPTMIIIPDECMESAISSDNGNTEGEGWQKENKNDINEVALLAYGPDTVMIQKIIVSNSLPYDLYEMLYLNPVDEGCLKEIFEKHRLVFVYGNQFRNRILDYRQKHRISTETVFIEKEDISELFKEMKEVIDA